MRAATCDVQHPGVDARERLERGSRHMADQPELPPRLPTQAHQRVRMDLRPLPRHLVLQQSIQALERRSDVVEEPGEDPRAEREREVPEDSIGLARERHVQGVRSNDRDVGVVGERRPKAIRPHRIAFDGDQTAGTLGQRRGEPAGSRADLHHQITRGDTSLFDELGREASASKEMLPVRLAAARAWRALLRGHGPSP